MSGNGKEDRIPGVFVLLGDDIYFIEGDPDATMTKIKGALQSNGIALSSDLIDPDDLFRFGDEEIRAALSPPISIFKGRK